MLSAHLRASSSPSLLKRLTLHLKRDCHHARTPSQRVMPLVLMLLILVTKVVLVVIGESSLDVVDDDDEGSLDVVGNSDDNSLDAIDVND